MFSSLQLKKSEDLIAVVAKEITMQNALRIAQSTIKSALLVGAALLVAVVIYQNLRLACRPNCAGADLRGALLYRPYSVADPDWGLASRLRDVDFRTAFLDEVDLRGGWLRRADLSGATIAYATLRHADFAWAKMRQADLRHADLFRANLYDVDLKDAILVGADLRQAYLVDADLSCSDLTGANLVGAKYSPETVWPEGFDQAAVGAILDPAFLH